ncbi:hypothetical protein ACP6PL_04765 [Dapis sp. BLCC M126]|uniref:hypothetical protein n=1 Tax=Dapis sp. BLCC M126 TaxID=3400189 RepID=UPI003CE78E84
MIVKLLYFKIFPAIALCWLISINRAIASSFLSFSQSRHQLSQISILARFNFSHIVC